MAFRSVFAWVLLIGLVAAGAGLGVLRCEGDAPSVRAEGPVLVGRDGGGVALRLSDAGSGLRSARVVLQHARGEAVLLERSFAGGLLGGGPAEPASVQAAVEIDPEALDLEDGSAVLRIRARDWSWRNGFDGNEAQLELPVEIDLEPPRIRVASGLTYVQRGGAAAVVYRVAEDTQRDGVQVGEAFFEGAPLPAARGGANGGGEGRRVAIFAVPADAPPDVPIRVVAADRVGNRSAAGWPTRLRERDFPDVTIRLPESFLEGKVREIAAESGIEAQDAAAAFAEINTRVRAQSEARVRELLGGVPSPKRFSGAFAQLRSSAVTSRFAEHRSYFADGEKVSEATHYGYDLASTAASPVTASNAGRVVFAGDLGIYGQCVLLDHGLGVTTLYGHLSRIDVRRGDAVEKGARLGLTGATGLAGGDHLHFAVLVGDTYVDPVEWWDPKWVREHIAARITPEKVAAQP